MKAYKITNNGKCKNQLYEVDKTYQIDGDLIMCQNGFHFCKNSDDLFRYYPYRKNITKIFEIEVLSECIDEGDKSVTDKLKIVREIPFTEYNDLFKKYSFDENYNLIYFIDSNGYEEWRKYDDNGKIIHHKSSNGYERWYEYDDKGNLIHYIDSNLYEKWYEYNYNNIDLIHFKDSHGYEEWKEYDNNGNLIHYKNSNGIKF